MSSCRYLNHFNFLRAKHQGQIFELLLPQTDYIRVRQSELEASSLHTISLIRVRIYYCAF